MKRFRDLAVFLFFSLSIVIVVAGSLFNYYLSPVSRDIIEKEIQITDGKNVDAIVDMLYNKKLIRNPKVFRMYLKIYDVRRMKEGSFKLSQSMSSKEIIKKLSVDE